MILIDCNAYELISCLNGQTESNVAWFHWNTDCHLLTHIQRNWEKVGPALYDNKIVWCWIYEPAWTSGTSEARIPAFRLFRIPKCNYRPQNTLIWTVLIFFFENERYLSYFLFTIAKDINNFQFLTVVTYNPLNRPKRW